MQDFAKFLKSLEPCVRDYAPDISVTLSTMSENGQTNHEEITMDDIWDFMDELRSVARRLLNNETEAYSIRPTALVLSALKRSRPVGVNWEEVSWANQRHFFKAMHTHMLWYLRDRARYRSAQRRPKLVAVEPENIDFFNLPSTLEEMPHQIVALDEALAWLRRDHPSLAEVIQHRFFTGLTIEETGALLGVSRATVKRRWREAKVLLYERVLEYLNGDGSTGI